MLDQEFQFKPSKIFFAYVLFLWGGGMLSLFLTHLAYSFTFFAVIFIFSYCAFIVWQMVLLRGKNTIVKLIYLGDRFFELHTAHEVFEARLKPNSLITAFLCVLRFQKERKMPALGPPEGTRGFKSCQPCIVFKDALTERQYRHLLILMKNA